jgi:hypothetical protein
MDNAIIAFPVERQQQIADPIPSPEAQIRQELLGIDAGVGDVLERIIRCGNLFRAQKERLAHGDFGSWLAREFPNVNRRTVTRWMKAAETFNEQIGHAVSNSKTLRGLLGVDQANRKKAKSKGPMLVLRFNAATDRLTKSAIAFDKAMKAIENAENIDSNALCDGAADRLEKLPQGVRLFLATVLYLSLNNDCTNKRAIAARKRRRQPIVIDAAKPVQS